VHRFALYSVHIDLITYLDTLYLATINFAQVSANCTLLVIIKSTVTSNAKKVYGLLFSVAVV